MEKIIMKKARRRGAHKSIIFFLLILAAFSLYYFYSHQRRSNTVSLSENAATSAPAAVIPYPEKKVEITEDSTYGSLLAAEGVDYQTQIAIYDAALPYYNLSTVKLGGNLDLTYEYNGVTLKKLIYQIDSESKLRVEKVCTSTPPAATATGTALIAATSTAKIADDGTDLYCAWTAAVDPIAYDVKIRVASGTVETSMYQAALDNNIDIRAIIALANAFQWSIDFAMDPRVGDTFKLIYEERYLNGKYVMPGRILAGRYVNDGTPYDVYYFEEDKDNKGYFDADGNSVQKMFLKAPVEFKYISSGYTTGRRVVMEFGLSGPHRAIDYAAALGTPIRAVGDGTVVFAGWNSHGYGNFTSIRHNATYTTNYAHQSKILVHVGQKIKQGDIIGLVGSTGYSTGPHVHFEMVKNGVKINPLTEVLPPGKPIKDENKDRFFATITLYQKMLK